MKNSIANLIVCLLLAASAAAQGTAPSAPPQASGNLTSDQRGDSEGSTARTFFGQTFSGQWVFSADANYRQEYDDNVFSQEFNRVGDSVSRFSTRFSATVQKKQLRIQIHYFPDYALYNKYTNKNAFSHQYGHEVGYRWSAHTDLNWQLMASRSPGSSNSPYQLVGFGGFFFPIFRPEAMQNDATITNATSSVSWTHRFSARNTLTVSSQGSIVKFDTINGVPLVSGASRESFSGGGTIRWEDEWIPRHHLGVEAEDRYFGFLNPGSHTHYQYVKVRYSEEFGHGFQLSAGAGPSRTERQAQAGLVTAAQTTGYSIDASLAKIADRQSVGISYNHGAQLGMTQGSLGSDSVDLFYSRQIGRKWSTGGSFGYSRSVSDSVAQRTVSNNYSSNAYVGYQLLPQLGINASYSYVDQMTEQLLPGGLNFYRNVFSVGLRYSFRVAAGR